MDLETEYAPTPPAHISNRLITGCAALQCPKSTNLSRCTSCKVVLYCSREHQTSDWTFHKKFCTRVKKAQAILDKEEATLRAHPGNDLVERNPFETCVAYFWAYHGTRPYVCARYAVVDALSLINTRAAVQTALDHALDMFRLCEGVDIQVQFVLSTLLRVGQDQECYDLCKVWVNTSPLNVTNIEQTSPPYAYLKGEDVFEPASVLLSKKMDPPLAAAFTLLKIRLLLDLQTLRRATREVGTRLPREILDNILQFSVGSIVGRNRRILEQADHTPRIQNLKVQVKRFFDYVHKTNSDFWPALLRLGLLRTQKLIHPPSGDWGRFQIKTQYYYTAWAETPGAIEVIKSLLKASGAHPSSRLAS